MSAALDASTVTPGSTPPDPSRTTPAIALSACAVAAATMVMLKMMSERAIRVREQRRTGRDMHALLGWRELKTTVGRSQPRARGCGWASRAGAKTGEMPLTHSKDHGVGGDASCGRSTGVPSHLRRERQLPAPFRAGESPPFG